MADQVYLHTLNVVKEVCRTILDPYCYSKEEAERMIENAQACIEMMIKQLERIE